VHLSATGDPVQIAYLTDDVEQAALGWAKRGAGPFFLRTSSGEDITDPASPDPSTIVTALGQWGALMVELILRSPNAPKLFWEPALANHGIHHIASFANDFEVLLRELEKGGPPVALALRNARGNRTVFLDTRGETGHYFEIYEPHPGLFAVYDMVREAALGWDGRDPLRLAQ